MKKIKDIHVLLVLTFIMLLIMFMTVGGHNLYGSTTDWFMQHTVFPDYFRTLFYNTGDITPNLALNIGAGQNVYYFSYYGLLNPLILISYLLPFIRMINYLMLLNISIVIISAFLIYKWLCNNKVDKQISIISAILFLLINAFFHAHRHIMFVDYMPFLILGLMGIDKYFKDKKSFLYIISVFLMIMTSYYYSVGGLLCLGIYGIYKYLQINKTIHLKSFVVDGIKFLIPMVSGILMSFILLLPTAFAILASRSQVNDIVTAKDLFIPHFNFGALLYDNYGMGFTSIAVIALIYVLIHSKGAKRFLSSSMFILLIVPVFMYVLNGMLYLRGKVFIPISPLIILLVALFLVDLRDRKINLTSYVIVFISTILLSFIFDYHDSLFYLDIIVTSICFVVFMWKKQIVFVYAPLIIIALCSNIAINETDTYATRGIYDKLESADLYSMINKVNKEDQTFYRMSNITGSTSLTINKVYNASYYQTSIYSSTYNPNYKTFFDNIFNNAIPYRNNLMIASSNNAMFQTFMGIKYIITDKDNVPIGYKLVDGNDELGMYKNDYVLPLGYSSSSLMSSTEFDKLDYAYRNEALLQNIIVDDSKSSNYQSSIEKLPLDYDYIGDIDVEKNNDTYIIDTDKVTSITLKPKEAITNKILFIKFKLGAAPSCKTGDISITINNVTNKLTCKQWLYFNNNYGFEYVISNPKDITELKVEFSKGYFEISDIELYSLDYNKIKESVTKVDKFIIDKNRTKGNVIKGKINVKEDGYFATSIPYDKGFSVYVDGRKNPYEIVNKAFIGFPVSKGTYNITMVYKSPGYDIGVLGSAIGIIMLIGIMIVEKKKDKKIA